MKLYYSPNSAASQRVRLVLAEKQLAYESEIIDLALGEQFKPEYKQLNPDAVVPTLLHDDQVVRECSLICQYLDDAFPEHALTPLDSHERFQMRLILRRCDELHQACGDLSYAVLGGPMLALKGQEEMAAMIDRMPSAQNRAHRRAVIFEGIRSSEFSSAVQQHRQLFAAMEQQLSSADYLVGDKLSLADLALLVYTSRVVHVGLMAELNQFRNLEGWHLKMTARTAYQQTFDESTHFIEEVMKQTGQDLFPQGRATV